MADDQDITPAILLQHMQGMEQRLLRKIEDVRTELLGEIRLLQKKTSDSLESLRRKIELLSVQIGNIDERLDDLEVVQVPMLKKAVGIGGKAGR